MTEERTGRADLHIHSLASDGTAGVVEILEHAEHRTRLDVIAITDHERIDGGVAAQRIADARGFRVRVVVGEEVSTRGGHLLALFISERIPPWRSLRETVARVHDQGGLAIVAHPLVPYPLCASGRSIRRLLADSDTTYHPDGMETFNPTTAGMPWQGRLAPFSIETGLAQLGNSDAHRAEAVGHAWTAFPGTTPEELRRAIVERTTVAHGSRYPFGMQLRTFGRQLRKYGRDIRDEARGKLLRDGTGRDLGYPGGHRRPARLEKDQLQP